MSTRFTRQFTTGIRKYFINQKLAPPRLDRPRLTTLPACFSKSRMIVSWLSLSGAGFFLRPWDKLHRQVVQTPLGVLVIVNLQGPAIAALWPKHHVTPVAATIKITVLTAPAA